MEALSRFWRIVVIIFKGLVALWKKIQAYRALKAQQKQEALDSTTDEGASSEPTPTEEVIDQEVIHLAPDESSPPSEVTASGPPVQEKIAPKEAADLSTGEDKPKKVTASSKPEISKQDSAPDLARAEEKCEAGEPPTQQTEIPIPIIASDDSDSVAENGRWIPPGEAFKIRSYLIPDGMVYRGQRLNALGNPAEQDLALINPRLKVTTVEGEARTAILQEVWGGSAPLSYKTLTPEMRGVYLGWLATGRKSKDIPAEGLLLFLYGIERRVLELLQGDASVDELLALILELERLEVQYAHHESLTGNIQQLIECCQVQLALTCQPETLLALLPVEKKLSTALKVALGKCLEEGKPIPMALLWSWYQSSSVAVDLKTPAKRCESEFNFLLHSRGEEKNFAIAVGETPPRIPFIYSPFNPCFGNSPDPIEIVETLEISGFEPQLTFFEPLIEDCTHELSAYSRLVGRSPEIAGTPAAVALLPQDLIALVGNSEVQGIKQWFQDKLDDAPWVVCAGEELLAQWPTKDPDKIRKKEAELFAQLLAKFGFGYTPDVRYGLGTFNPTHPVILFQLPEPGIEEISREFSTALLGLEFQPFLERDGQILEQLQDSFTLTSGEWQRLAAILQWRKERPITWRQYLARFKKLGAEEKHQLENFFETEALAHPLEEKKYKELQEILNLEELDVLTFHALNVIEEDICETDEVTPMKDAQISASPEVEEEEEPAPPAFILDTALIAQRSQESQIASGLLDDIFTEEDVEAEAPAPPSVNQETEDLQNEPVEKEEVLGLDSFHWHLLHHLGQKECWERSELEAIAQEQGLLLDGALENINDVAFDHCDEALTEGEDPIEINDWVYEELKAA